MKILIRLLSIILNIIWLLTFPITIPFIGMTKHQDIFIYLSKYYEN